ncbi:MAG: ATP-dependent sacrificial sulfur transferase LarE, partial [Proteobacteria bacterium]|nr:ATP-dependent sacrificial sulfur transferase LarE [Pseudomonadota bacterium]
MKKINLKEKRNRLVTTLKKFDALMIAFSGGVDSTFLLACAREILQDNLVAVTAQSALQPQREKAASVALAKHLGVRHIVVQTREMYHHDFVANTTDRCYICKKYLFADLLKLASEMGILHLAHGANKDDLKDFRPGFIAALEMGIHAPLIDAGLTKADIRLLSKEMKLETWNKPPMACLATRIPYGTPITVESLAMIEKAEDYILSLGVKSCRVRIHEKTARIELDPAEFG